LPAKINAMSFLSNALVGAACVALIVLGCHRSQPLVEDRSAGHANRSNALTGRKWILVQLRGTDVVMPVGATEAPYIQFDGGAKQVNGFAGCNRFFGPYEQGGDTTLTFGNMGSTMMACPDMSVEQTLFAVMAQVNGYAVLGDTLTIHRARMVPLARFVSAAP
jgi:heat shock protein HslJ